MRRIIAYKLLTEDSDYLLNEKINALIDQGYELYGCPSIAMNQHRCKICQAMVKYEQKPNSVDHFPEDTFTT